MDNIFPEPFEVQNRNGKFPAVFCVEHARNTIPSALTALGVSDNDLQKHIAYDIGIEGVTRLLSDALDVPSIYCTYSRLIIDPNRALGHPQCILPESDGIAVPANRGLTEEEKRARIEGIYKPYHAAAAEMIDDALGVQPQRLIVGMHSCTDRMNGGPYREWPIGLSTYCDDAVMEAFAAPFVAMGFKVGLHEPYNIKPYTGTSLDTHARARQMPHILVEIRQDLIGDAQGQQRWAEIMRAALIAFAPTIPSLFPALPR